MLTCVVLPCEVEFGCELDVSCNSPLRAFQAIDGRVFFDESHRNQSVRSIRLPCGRCMACRLQRSQAWAIRCMHEAQLHPVNSFVTLTYRPADLPSMLRFNYHHFRLFIRRTRRTLGPTRFFMCGEFGNDGRPHFHAILFGVGFADRVRWKQSGDGYVYRSKMLESLWPYGFSTVGDVTVESAQYVARYIFKKELGTGKSRREILDPTTGEILERDHEFCRCSLRPGIASDWLRLYWPDVVDGEVTMLGGVKLPLPTFYKRRLRKMKRFEDAQFRREQEVKARADDSDARLAVKELVLKERIKMRKREL